MRYLSSVMKTFYFLFFIITLIMSLKFISNQAKCYFLIILVVDRRCGRAPMAETGRWRGEERWQLRTGAVQGQGRRRMVPAGGRRGRQLSWRHTVHSLGNRNLTYKLFSFIPNKSRSLKTGRMCLSIKMPNREVLVNVNMVCYYPDAALCCTSLKCQSICSLWACLVHTSHHS